MDINIILYISAGISIGLGLTILGFMLFYKKKVEVVVEEKIIEKVVEKEVIKEIEVIKEVEVEKEIIIEKEVVVEKEVEPTINETIKPDREEQINKIFNIPSVNDFNGIFASDEECLQFLQKMKWKEFKCPKCNHTNYAEGTKPYTRRCTRCKHTDSVTSQTLVHGTRIPMTKAFRIISHVVQRNPKSLDSLSKELEIRKGTVYDYAARVNEKLEKDKPTTVEDLFL